MTQQTKVLQKKGTLQVIRRVVPIRQDIAYSFCFTGAETKIHKIKDNSKIIMQTNLDRRGLGPIPIICHCLDPPSFSLSTTFKYFCLLRRFYIDATMPLAPLGNAQQYCSVFNFQLVFRGLFLQFSALCLRTQSDSVRQ
jgi:hypothetical protein